MRYYDIKFKNYQVSEENVADFLAAMPNGLEMTISPFEVSNEVHQAESDMDKVSSESPLPSKYTRDIEGHTKLVRKGSEIFLAKRHEKANGEFENVNYPDAVLLTDKEKDSFIDYCKDAGLSQYRIKQEEKAQSFKVWSDFIDSNYKENYHE